MVECQAVKHLAHIKANFALRTGQGSPYLSEHCVVINVNFNKRSVFSVHKRQIAIDTVIRTTIRDGYQFVVRAAEDITKGRSLHFTTRPRTVRLTVEIPYKGRCLAYQQDPFPRQ